MRFLGSMRLWVLVPERTPEPRRRCVVAGHGLESSRHWLVDCTSRRVGGKGGGERGTSMISGGPLLL